MQPDAITGREESSSAASALDAPGRPAIAAPVSAADPVSAPGATAAAVPSAAAGSLGVFADPAGRRRIVVGRLAAVAGLLLCVYLVVTVIGLLGGPKAPLMPWPELQAQPRTGPVPSTHPSREQPSSPAGPTVQDAPTPPAGLLFPSPSPTRRPARRTRQSRSPTPAPSRTPTQHPSSRPTTSTPSPTLPLLG